MPYVALYRKYRSQTFEEVAGQDQVTTTLQNALRTGRIAHAYLFYGARGCGKTSTARLLSRALNCVAQDGPTPTPCGVCRLCVSIRENTCMDVTEIDAASETGVDNVREKIIENVQYAAGEARYKVYIIDEVHDLSAKAFDALLKTLEEPPPHVVFILATTEYHKVPITIRSRCQGYQFKRGSVHDLGAAVERVIKAEGFTAEPEAIQAIARSAEGSWRDALSILEQVLAYSDGHITGDIVHRALGTVGTEMLARVTATLAQGAWDETLNIASDLVDSGTDVRQLMTALGGHLRDLMLLSTGAKQAAAQELGPDRLALLKPQANLFEPALLLDMMGQLSNAERELRFSNQHRAILENTLLRLMMIGQGASAGDAQPRPAARLQTGTVQAVAKTLPRPATTPSYADNDERPGASTAATPAPSVVPRPPTQQAAQSFAAAKNTPAASNLADDEDDEEEADNLTGADDLPEIGEDTYLAPPLALTPDPARQSANTVAQSEYTAIPSTPSQASTPSSNSVKNGADNGASIPAAVPASTHKFADDVTLEVLQRAWERIVKSVLKVSPAGGGFLEKAAVAGLEGKIVILSFKDVFARDRIQSKAKELVEKKINEGLKTDGYRIQCLLEGQYGNDGQNGSGGLGVKPTAPPPPNGSGGAAMMEMPTLLDAPPPDVVPGGPSRVMDFEIHSAPTPPPQAGAPRTEAGDNTAPSPVPGANANGAAKNGYALQPPPAADPSKGMLKEALDIFGGKVISTEDA